MPRTVALANGVEVRQIGADLPDRNSPSLSHIARVLKRFSAAESLPLVAGLLTIPELQANAVRLEALVHLVVRSCGGVRVPDRKAIHSWLNRELGATELAMAEDPPEDVFVTNIRTAGGDRRIFEGLWEGGAYHVQSVIDALSGEHVPEECRALLGPVLALLRVSDCIAERLGLRRWTTTPSSPKGTIVLPRTSRIAEHARAVTFSFADIAALGLSIDALLPFVLREDDREGLQPHEEAQTALERRPLVRGDTALIVALPSAISIAARTYLVTELGRLGYRKAFAQALAREHARQLEHEALLELTKQAKALPHVTPDRHFGTAHSVLLKYDACSFLHILLLHDDLDAIDEDGVGSFRAFPEDKRVALDEYIAKIAAQCRALADWCRGTTVIVVGGIGRGTALGLTKVPHDWPVSFIHLSNLLLLAHEQQTPLARLLKCLRQREWVEAQGVQYINFNDDFAFYSYWRELHYQLVPRELSLSRESHVVIATDMAFALRREVRTGFDRHLATTPAGLFATVGRLGHDSFQASLRKRPVYASLDHLASGILAGVVETERGLTWLYVEARDGTERSRRGTYEFWSGFMGPVERLLAHIEARHSGTHRRPIAVHLDLTDVDPVDGHSGALTPHPASPIHIEVRGEQGAAFVRFPRDFFDNFRQPENTGERLTISSVATAVLRLLEVPPEERSQAAADALARSVLPDEGARIIHVFQTTDPLDYLAATRTTPPHFLAHEDFVFAKLDLWKGCVDDPTQTFIDDKDECNRVLNKIVDKVWINIRTLLRQLDRASVVQALLAQQEAIFYDRIHWRRTARAMVALYAPEDDVLGVARQREKDRNETAVPSRAVLEMAMCEAPAGGGRAVSQPDIDELVAKAALLIEAATDSDAIKSGVSTPRLRLHPDGEYAIDRRFHETVIHPFVAGMFREEFEEAVGDYESLYERPEQRKRPTEPGFSPAFSAAFTAEYGLPPAAAAMGVRALLEFAVLRDRVVVESTVGEAKSVLALAGLPPTECDAFLGTFGLLSRPSWDRPPTGFKHSEIYPWRFSRRLSAVVRPLMKFGESDSDPLFFGAASLRVAGAYLLGKSEDGQLSPEFFGSAEMRSYVGGVNDERGHAFARTVAEELTKQGWTTRVEVQMTELGAPPEYGDVDVLSWRPSGEVQLVECKRLRLARTVAEIAEICTRFRGEAKDELDRHMRRVKWVKENARALERVVGFTVRPAKIVPRLVTNTHVPMMYLRTLPIPADRIGPL